MRRLRRARGAGSGARRGQRSGVAAPALAGPGFFIPHRYAATAVARGYPELEPRFLAAEPAMSALIREIRPRTDRMVTGEPPPAPRWDQDWFPRLDAAAAYTLVQTARPARIVEIGSGHSTRFMARAIADAALATRLTCIDPAPRASLAGLAIEHLPHVLAPADSESVAGLGRDDILFIDSSHIAMPGTDVDLIVGTLLPRLGRGALVHVHDVFLPDAYPRQWKWRAYNEQIVVAALLEGGGYELIFSSRWIASRRPSWLRDAGLAEVAFRPGALESSMWLRKRD